MADAAIGAGTWAGTGAGTPLNAGGDAESTQADDESELGEEDRTTLMVALGVCVLLGMLCGGYLWLSARALSRKGYQRPRTTEAEDDEDEELD